MWDNINMWIYGLASALFAGVVLLIRKTLTSERKIEMLQQKLEGMEKSLDELKDDIKLIIRRNYDVDQ